MSARCEWCRELGITGRDAYAHRLTDGQRLTLCLSHARVWRLREPSWYPMPYGREARVAYAAGAIVGTPVDGGLA